MHVSASWQTLYIETLQELQVLSMVKQINQEIVLANVCEHCKDFLCHYCLFRVTLFPNG